MFKNIFSLHSSFIQFFLLVFFISSCKSDLERPKAQQEPSQFGSTPEGLQVLDGRLFFLDTTQIRLFMEFAQKEDFSSKYKTIIREGEALGFYSLYPEYGEDEEGRILRVVERKLKDRDRWIRAIPNLRTVQFVGEMEEEDEIIADPYYASILNENREIRVGDFIYKYTIEGLYKTKSENNERLENYLLSQNNLPPKVVGDIYEEVHPGIFLVRPSAETADFCESCQEPNFSGRISAEPIIDDFKLCDSRKRNLFTMAFGPKIECVDKFKKKSRVKTQIWKQKYVLFQSMGISVKSSKKRAKIWWSNNADELRLGLDHAIFKYPPVKLSLPGFDYNYFDQNGNLITQHGQAVNPGYFHPNNVFNTFPITNKDAIWFIITTKKPFLRELMKDCRNSAWDKCSVVELKGKLVNNQAKRLIDKGIKLGAKSLETKPKLIVESDNNGFVAMTYLGWNKTKTNTSAVRNVFDWSTAQVSITLNVDEGNFSNPKLKNTAKANIKEMNISGYGIGRRGSTWKGGRVEFKKK